MNKSPPSPNELIATLDGELGDEVQFLAILSRGKELIDQAIQLKRVITTEDVVLSSSLIYLRQ